LFKKGRRLFHPGRTGGLSLVPMAFGDLAGE
jgi:hypothetical protein